MTRSPLQKFLYFFFDQLYHAFAWGYDLVAWVVSLGSWQSWVYTIADELPSSSETGWVLELGYGPGHLYRYLVAQGYRVVGVDESWQMAKQAAKRARRVGLSPNVLRGVGESVPLANQSMTHVLATFPAPYIFHPRTLHEIYRVLAPGGNFVVLLGAVITGDRPLHRATRWLFNITGESPDPQASAYERIRAEMNNAGFLVEVAHVEQAHSRLVMVRAIRKQDLDGKSPINAKSID